MSRKLLSRIALLGILLAVLVIALLLFLWNRGTASTFDAEEIGTDFDTEELDMVFYVSDEDLATSDAAEDDEEHILFVGNEFFSDGEEEGTLPDLIGERLRQRTSKRVVTYNAAVPGSRVAPKSAEYNAYYPYDLASFLYLAGYIAQDDFAFLERYASDAQDETALNATKTLRTVDMQKIDMMVIGYDAIDYLGGTPVFNPGNDFDPVTYCGALRAGITTIRGVYPHIRFVFLFPTFCYIYDEEGDLTHSDILDIGNGDLTTYLIKAIDVCQDEGVSIIDNYSGTVDDGNAKRLLMDNIHLTNEARDLIADHVMRVLFPEGGAK